MSRYNKTNKNTKNNKNYYETTIYTEVKEKNTDSFFIATEGDRCDNLAHRFYNDSSLWWFIARVNNLTTNNIPAGTSLRIPASVQDAEGN
jgi:nucleoid-associated protein YgaU